MARTHIPWQQDRASNDDDKEKLKAQVLEYTVGNPSKGITPKNRKEIAKLMNRTPQWVWLQWKELAKEGKLKKDSETGYLIKSEQQKQELKYEQMMKSEFAQIPSVAKWVNDMKTAGKGGKPLSDWSAQVSFFNVVCNTINVHPDGFLQDVDTSAALLKQFVDKFKAGQAVQNKPHRPGTNFNYAIVEPKMYVLATRNFMNRNNMVLQRGISGIFSAKKPRFGAYANVKLTDREFEQGLAFMKGYGLASLYAILHEVFPRTTTGCKMVNKFEVKPIEVRGIRGQYASMRVFESKTERQFPKFVLDPRVLDIVKRTPAGAHFHDVDISNNTRMHALQNDIAEALRQFYISLGKISRSHYNEHGGHRQKWSYDKGTEEWYWANKSIYCLRHSGAHRAMRRTSSNATLVAAMGWDDPNTLLKAYAQISEAAVLMQDVCYFHNAPELRDPNYDYFCSMRCAIAYYNNSMPVARAVKKIRVHA